MQQTLMGISSNMFKFNFKYLKKPRMNANLSKSFDPRTPCMIGFKLKQLIELEMSVN